MGRVGAKVDGRDAHLHRVGVHLEQLDRFARSVLDARHHSRPAERFCASRTRCGNAPRQAVALHRLFAYSFGSFARLLRSLLRLARDRHGAAPARRRHDGRVRHRRRRGLRARPRRRRVCARAPPAPRRAAPSPATPRSPRPAWGVLSPPARPSISASRPASTARGICSTRRSRRPSPGSTPRGPGWRRERVGVAVGTSSGGMLTAERFFAARASGSGMTPEIARGATYFAPLDAALAAEGLGEATPRTQILAACAASSIAVGLGLRWLERGACDVVLAGGYDGVSVFVASGFEVLRATTASRPRPFRAGRDGMSLGEGAAIVALVRGDDTRGARVFARVAGFGASNDAVHITAPNRTGGGLARAALAALADAGVPPARIDLVSAHATATPFNDAMEARAIAAALRARARARRRRWSTLSRPRSGTRSARPARSRRSPRRTRWRRAWPRPPPAARTGRRSIPTRPRSSSIAPSARELRAALKLSAAFGGSNAALVLVPPGSPSGRAARPRRAVYLRASARVDERRPRRRSPRRPASPAIAWRASMRSAASASPPSLRSAREVGREALAGAGIVAGHALATIDTNDGLRRSPPRARPGRRRAARLPRHLAERDRGRVRHRLQAHGPELRRGRGARRRHGGARRRGRAGGVRRRRSHGGRRRRRRRAGRARSGPCTRAGRGARSSAGRWRSCSRRMRRTRCARSIPAFEPRTTAAGRSVTSRCCAGSTAEPEARARRRDHAYEKALSASVIARAMLPP